MAVAGSVIALRTYDLDPIVAGQARILLEEALMHLEFIGQHWGNVRAMVLLLFICFVLG